MLVNRGCGWQWRSRESLGTWTRFDFCLFLPKPLAASYRRICRALFVKALRRIVVRRLPRWPWSTCRGRSMSKNREFARLNSPLGCQTPPRRPLPTDWGKPSEARRESGSEYPKHEKEPRPRPEAPTDLRKERPRLWLGRGRVGRFWSRCCGWLCWCGRRALDGVRLIVQLDDFLGDVDIGRGEKNRRILRRGVEHGHHAVLSRIAIEHVHHLSSDSIHHVGLRGVYVFLQLVVLAIQLLRQPLALGCRPPLLLIAPGGLICLQLVPKIIDLVVHRLQFLLPRRELRLQFRGRLLALGRRDDGLPDVNYPDFSARGRSRRCLAPKCCCPDQAGRAEKSHLNDISRIHFFLLVDLQARHSSHNFSWTEQLPCNAPNRGPVKEFFADPKPNADNGVVDYSFRMALTGLLPPTQKA